MPLYEYQCRKCGNRFEMLRRIKDADCDAECPNTQVERQYSTFAAGVCGPGSRGFT